jgi:hypothetical protein
MDKKNKTKWRERERGKDLNDFSVGFSYEKIKIWIF